ncbi:hypothetical protein FB567DRAFT_538691 [Paraphoma chrysanthemicola]|uniref:RBR-type E3 ubiquitin transferase n=1 Tax=Paraphoma chrysanthemicola TaxID=798071 RepID=A0A8K0VTH3_9PLEO|nr:hypothetical protein FB567DRAFT_538691 [Paraphoma chrysanthemicola]
MARTRGTARPIMARRRMLRPLPPIPAPTPQVNTTRVLRSQTAAKTAAESKITKPKSKARRRRLDPWATKKKPNPNPKPRPPPPTHFTCRICIEEQSSDQFPRWATPKRGRRYGPWDVPFACIMHLARNPNKKKIDPVCNSCIGKAMSARLDRLGARQVGTGCLEPGCENIWPWDFIMKYMPVGEPLEKYNMEMLEVWKHDSMPKPVTCPAPDCGAIGLPDVMAPGYPQISCNSCSFRSCAQCLVPWHKDLTCAEFASKHLDEKMSDPEKDTLKLMQTKDGKRCPNCFLVIEKDGGCDSMLCLGCSKYFNWATAASAVPGAKKAEPFIHNNPWWTNPGPITCEVDALEGTTTTLPAVLAAT